MDPNREAFIEDIDNRLTALGCEHHADLTADARATAVRELIDALEQGGATELAASVHELAATAPEDTLVEALCAMWREWLGEEEARHDAAALAIDADLAAMFVAEAFDHLGSIEATLLKLESTPGDRELVDEVFRPFHTVKGNAGALGVTSVQSLAHKVENLLDLCRSGERIVASSEIDVVLKAVDLLTAMLNDLGARAAGKPGRTFRVQRLALMEQVDALIDAPSAAATAGAPEPVVAAEGVAAQAVADQPPFENRRAEDRDQTSVKVDTRKLDGLVDIVGELVILQSLIHEDATLVRGGDERLTRNMAQLKRITTELQRGATAMRMVPIRQTFQKMARLVRDVSKRANKSVELVLAGEDTELDRKVVEDISDPLMHMVRNSVDHGIEPADRRLAAGKRESGRLSLRAFHQGGSIVIEVADDGAGLNTDRIRAKAVANGLIAADSTLTPAEIHPLIFAPGFSTADQVTEISGRGVGMDVVKRNIEALRGRIDIASTAGQGTTFSIRLPLTLAIMDGLLVAAGAERFVIPTFAIRESLRPTQAQVHSVQGVPRLIQVRDTLLPLVWLKDLFAIDGCTTDPTAAAVVVLEDDRRRVGLVVDTLIGKQEVVVKSLGVAFANVDGVSGGAILGDGRIGLILDAHGIVRMTDDERDSSKKAA